MPTELFEVKEFVPILQCFCLRDSQPRPKERGGTPRIRHSERVLFINTLLQRGVGVWWRGLNRFSGFRQGVETASAEHPAESRVLIKVR